jgi:hypothetical protein
MTLDGQRDATGGITGAPIAATSPKVLTGTIEQELVSMSLVSRREDGPKAAVARNGFPEPKRRNKSTKKITDPTIARARAIAYFRQRLDGMTNHQIGVFWCVSIKHVQNYINGLPESIRDQVRIQRLRAFRSEHGVEGDADRTPAPPDLP